MNTQKKNIILVLVVGLILSVNYGAYAESVAAEEQLIGTDEKTKEIIKLHDENLEETKELEESKEPEEISKTEETAQTEETEETKEDSKTEETTQTEETEEDSKTEETTQTEETEEDSKTEETTQTEETEETKEDTETEETVQTEEAEETETTEKFDDMKDPKETKEVEKEEKLSKLDDQYLLDGNVVLVSNWDEFKEAFDNESVSQIQFKNNINGYETGTASNNRLKNRSTDLEINGNGYTLNSQTHQPYNYILFFLSGTGTFTLKNMEIVHSNYNIIHSTRVADNWTINLKNISNRNSEYKTKLANGDGIKSINIFGEIDWESAGTDTLLDVDKSDISIIDAKGKLNSNRTIFSSKSLSIDGFYGDLFSESQVFNVPKINIRNYTGDINAEGTIFNSSQVLLENYRGNITNSSNRGYIMNAHNGTGEVNFKVLESEIYIENKNTSGTTFRLGTTSNGDGVLFSIGSNSDVKIKSHSTSTGDGEAVVAMRGNSINNPEKFRFEVKESSKLNITGQKTQILFMQIRNGSLTKVDGEGTLLEMIQKEAPNSNTPVMRFYLVGNQRFVTSNKAKSVIKAGKDGNSQAIRMYGGGNQFSVQSGSQVKIYNPGNGVPTNPGVEHKNQAILFQGGSSSNSSRFEVMGEDSSIDIKADYGASIDGSNEPIDVSVGPGTSFIARGNTANARGAIFNAFRLTFTTNKPKYYDFANTNKDGGLVFKTSRNESIYTSTQSDLAVWKIGSDINGNPHRSWAMFDFALSGEFLQHIETTSESDEFTTAEDSFGNIGMAAYSRISGNNATPTIEVLPIPFDTDRYIYGYAIMPEGVDSVRRAWTDEVHVDIKETLPNGIVKIYEQLPTVGTEYGKPGYPVYDVDESQRGGYFRVDLGSGNLATIDAKYEVIKAYRGAKDLDEHRKRYVDESKLPQEVVVIDKTPPEIASIDTPIYNKQNIIKGTSKEKEVTVSLVLDGEVLKDKNNKPVSKNIENGKWEFNLSDIVELEAGQILHVVLEDLAGNKNPLEDTEFHDITKYEASHVKIKESLFTLDAKDLYISLEDFDQIENHKGLIRAMSAKAKEERETIIEHEVIILDDDNLDFENTKDGSYIINFAIKNFESITLEKQLHIMPYDNVIEGDQYVIVANDFYASRLDYKKEDKEIIKLANAKAFEKQDMTHDVGVLLTENTLKRAKGVYPLEFKVLVDDKTKVKIEATVLNNDHVVESDEYLLVANDFSIMDYMAVGIEDRTILEQSDAQAWRIRGWEAVPVEVISHNIEPIVDDYIAKLGIKKSKQ